MVVDDEHFGGGGLYGQHVSSPSLVRIQLRVSLISAWRQLGRGRRRPPETGSFLVGGRRPPQLGARQRTSVPPSGRRSISIAPPIRPERYSIVRNPIPRPAVE